MRLTGLGVSPGIGIGKALVAQARHARPALPRAAERRVASSWSASTRRASGRAHQLQQIRQRIAQSAGAEHAYMFDAQLLMLDDPMLIDRAAAIIRDERLNAGSALQRALDEISRALRRGEDAYLRERKGDVARRRRTAADEPAGRRRSARLFKDLEGPSGARRRRAHTVDDRAARLAAARRARHRRGQLDVPHRDPGAVDPRPGGRRAARRQRASSRRARWSPSTASTGEVFVDPGPDALADIEARSQQAARAYEQSLDEYRDAAAGHRGRRADSPRGQRRDCRTTRRARGSAAPRASGCIRSEFLLGGASGARRWPRRRSTSVYRRLIEAWRAGRVTVRTFDVSEAQLGLTGHAEGARAPLGLRGMRLSLAIDDVFQAQLRALLRAAAHGPLRIMFPFVSGVEELRAARAAVAPRRGRTAQRAAMPVPDVPIGIMIEVPSAALTADLLAERSGLLQHRHQRSDPVLPGRRSHRRPRLAPVRAAAPGDPAHAAARRARARRRARGSRCRSAARWPPTRCCCRCWSASACASSAWRRPPSRSPSRCCAACSIRDAARAGRPGAQAATAAEVETGAGGVCCRRSRTAT